MFLDFFASKGHLVMKSFSLIPQNDNSLLLINAGMAPLYYGNSQFFVQEYVKNLSTPNFGAALEFSRAYISGKE